MIGGVFNRKFAPPALVTLFVFIYLAGVGVILLVGWAGAVSRAHQVDTEFRYSLLQNAVRMAAFIDPEKAMALSFTADDVHQDAYQSISADMKAFARILDGRGIYSMTLRNGDILFGPETYMPGDPLSSPPGTPYLEPPPEALAVFETRTPVVFGPHEDAYGAFITALAPVSHPITGETVLVVGFEVSADDWRVEMAQARMAPLIPAGLLLLALLVADLLLYYKYRKPQEEQVRWRHLDALLVVVLGLAISNAVSFWIDDGEQRERRAVFRNLAELHAVVLNQHMQRVGRQIDSLARFFGGSEHITESEFLYFSEPFLLDGFVHSLGWLHREGDAADDEMAYSARTGKMPAPVKQEVIRRLMAAAPVDQNVQWGRLGTHLFERADSDLSRGTSMALFRYTRSQPVGSDARIAQSGWVYAIIEVQDLFGRIFGKLVYEAPLVSLRLEDIADTESIPLASYPDPNSFKIPCATDPNDRFVQPIAAWGRVFALTACPTPAFIAAYPARGARVVGLAGFALTLLIAALTSIIGQRQRTLSKELSDRRFRKLFESMADGFALHELVYDAEGRPVDYRFLEINGAFERQTGLRAENLIGRRLYEILPETEPFWLQRYAPVAQGRGAIHFEHYALVLDRYFSVTAYSPEPNQFATLVTDITPRKRIEEKLARYESLQRLLTDMALRFINLPTKEIEVATRSALEEIGRFTRVDRAYQFRYDWEKRIMVNTHEWCADGITPQIDDLQDVAMDAIPKWVDTHQRGEVLYVPDATKLSSENPLREILISQDIRSLVTVPLMQGNRCIGFIGFDAVRDVREWTEEEIALLKVMAQLLANVYVRRENEEQQRLLEQQVQQTQKLESLGLLAGGIAHDFNNLLTTILGNADLAQRDISPVSPVRENLRNIEIGARRAADLCRQMLAYAGKGSFLVDAFSLNELIEEMVHLLKTSISKRALFNLHLEPKLPPIKGDASQIRQIILNLVINASEALEDRSGTVSVSTGALLCDADYLQETLFDFELKPGLYVTLEVADTGCGMDKATIAQIFDPFFTTKFTGRGLGLSAVMGIIRSHGGALKVYSETGRGSVFKMLLPAVDEPITQPAGEKVAPSMDKDWKGSGGVLLVEDEESIRSLGRHILERIGFSVFPAADGVEALELHANYRDQLTVAILDLTMPRKGGEETLRELKKVHPELPVIIASGYSKEEIAARLAVKGAAGFIQKPYSMPILRETLRMVLGNDVPDDGQQG